MRRIGGSRRTWARGLGGGNLEIPPSLIFDSNRRPSTGGGTVPGGEFDWGGRLLKGNGGAQRFPQAEWKPAGECKGTRELDCETYKSSRDESRA